MIRTRFILATLLGLPTGVLIPHAAQAQFVPQEPTNPPIYKKSDLPVNGTLVQHPKYKHLSYYFVNAGRIAQNHTDSGLYESIDTGQTWRKIESFFGFQRLFIHPDSGELFAIIQDNVLTTDDKGFLVIHEMSKAVSSIDGVHWKDIMGKLGRVAELHDISVDPDNPNRVRLSGWAFRGFYLVAMDDAYSEWKRVAIPSGPPF